MITTAVFGPISVTPKKNEGSNPSYLNEMQGMCRVSIQIYNPLED
jgi:hypothetical protein